MIKTAPHDICKNPEQVYDRSRDSAKQVLLCTDKITYGGITVVQKKTLPDLFRYRFLDKEDQPVKTYVDIFQKSTGIHYIAVRTMWDYTTGRFSAVGIFKEQNGTFTPIFRKTFDENRGRGVDISFHSSPGLDSGPFDYSYISISGDVGKLGCYGCRMEWTDYYDWNQDAGTFLLANNAHVQEFEQLKSEYEERDKTACSDVADAYGARISDLFPDRHDKEQFCGDNAMIPYISNVEAGIFMKAKQTITDILAGKNVTIPYDNGSR